MIVKKKLVKHGNSLALVIDKPILEMLKINEKTVLELAIENNELIIKVGGRSKPEGRSSSDAQIEAIAEKIMDRYSDVFKKLAK